MYFTDTPELRKFERQMKQKPNFDRRNDYSFDNESSHKRKDIKSDDNKKFRLYTKCWGKERAYKINLKNFQKK